MQLLLELLVFNRKTYPMPDAPSMGGPLAAISSGEIERLAGDPSLEKIFTALAAQAMEQAVGASANDERRALAALDKARAIRGAWKAVQGEAEIRRKRFAEDGQERTYRPPSIE